jgi:hypothetical protein
MKSSYPVVLRTLSWFIKIAIVIAAACYIYQKIIHRTDLSGISKRFSNQFSTGNGFFIAAFFLLFLNWGLEAFKWKLLLVRLQPLSYLQAVRSVLAGVTTGVFTPNRAGEFGGRVLSLPPGIRIEASLLSFAGGLLQLLVTVLMALPAVCLLESTEQLQFRSFPVFYVCMAVSIAGAALLWTFRNRIAPGAKKYYALFQGYTLRRWIAVFGLSAARYLVFSIQFLLLLYGFGVYLPIGAACLSIPLVFFATTVIPTFALSEIGIRGTASLLFLGLYANDPAGILGASFLLWIINVAFPALAGAVFVLRADTLFSKTQA